MASAESRLSAACLVSRNARQGWLTNLSNDDLVDVSRLLQEVVRDFSSEILLRDAASRLKDPADEQTSP